MRRYIKKLILVESMIFLFLLAGCPVTQPQNVPERILYIYNERYNRNYYVYLPSSFGRRPLPLVITCHGTPPWDTADKQINEWKYLAEKNGFVVVAPEINSARGFIPPGVDEGKRILLEDEMFILDIVRKLTCRGNVRKDAIFITGWSSGGFVTYFAGLRHPEIFRAIAARQCNYIREYYEAEFKRADKNQPIFIFYGRGDIPILQADSKVAYEELKKAGMRNVKLLAIDGGHFRHPEIAWGFFKKVLKNEVY